MQDLHSIIFRPCTVQLMSWVVPAREALLQRSNYDAIMATILLTRHNTIARSRLSRTPNRSEMTGTMVVSDHKKFC